MLKGTNVHTRGETNITTLINYDAIDNGPMLIFNQFNSHTVSLFLFDVLVVYIVSKVYFVI